MAIPAIKPIFGHGAPSYTQSEQYEQQMKAEIARQMMDASVSTRMTNLNRRDKDHLGIKVTKIGNGLMVNINGEQLYGATPQDIADLIAAQWTKLQLEGA
jgi:hypothetical protein